MHQTSTPSLSDLLAGAKNALDRNDLAGAKKLSDLAILAAPNNPNPYLLAGRIAGREGRWGDAIDHFRHCAAVAPAAAAPHFWMGSTFREIGNNENALAAFKVANRLSPREPATIFNLGLSYLALGDHASAGEEFVLAAQLSGKVFDAQAHQNAIECALALAEVPYPGEPYESARIQTTDDPMVSIVCCSITPKKANALRKNLEKLLVEQHWEFVVIDDAHSLSEGYIRGIAKSTGDVVVLCHDDIEIIVDDFYERLIDALTNVDIVGVAGTTLVNGPAVFWARHPYCHGWVTHSNAQGDLIPTPMSMAPPRVDGAQALDGVFIAAHRKVFDRVQFDPITFDGFHFYDLDFTYRAFLAGLRVRIQCDILLIHASEGNFGQDHSRYAERFASKFPGVGAAPPSPPITFRSAARDKKTVRNLYRWLTVWALKASSS